MTATKYPSGIRKTKKPQSAAMTAVANGAAGYVLSLALSLISAYALSGLENPENYTATASWAVLLLSALAVGVICGVRLRGKGIAMSLVAGLTTVLLSWATVILLEKNYAECDFFYLKPLAMLAAAFIGSALTAMAKRGRVSRPKSGIPFRGGRR